MSILSRYFKIISFALLALIGIQLPGFVTSYGNNLAARLAESKLALVPFQETANRHFSGNMDKLIEHYANNKDVVITEASDNIEQIHERHQLLNSSMLSFKTSGFKAYQQTFLQPIPDVQKQVWKNYNFQVLLNGNAIMIGLIFAITLLILFEIFVWLFKGLFFRNKAAKA